MKLSKELLQKVSMISWKNSMNGFRRRAVLRKNSVDQIESLNDILKKFQERCRKMSYLKKFHGPNRGKAYVGVFWQKCGLKFCENISTSLVYVLFGELQFHLFSRKKSFTNKRLRIYCCFASFSIFTISNFHI